jgi:dephospho-CoA kinase
LRLALGLTGKYCAGKDLAARTLAEEGFAILDADRMGHEALEEAKGEIEGKFGPGLIDPEGRLDRKELGRRVFRDPEKLAALERIVHPIVIARIVAELDRPSARRICVNAALLYRTDIPARCDAVIEVRAPLFLRVLRGLGRDRIGLAQVLSRISRQRDLRPGRELPRGKVIAISNRSSPAKLAAKLRAVLGRLEARKPAGK